MVPRSRLRFEHPTFHTSKAKPSLFALYLIGLDLQVGATEELSPWLVAGRCKRLVYNKTQGTYAYLHTRALVAVASGQLRLL